MQSGDLHQWTWTVCCRHECGANYRWEGCTHTITIFIDSLLVQARLILSPGHCTYMYLTLNSTTITIFIDILLMQARLMLSPGHCTYMYLTLNSTTITIFIDILLMQARLILSPGHCTYMYLTLNSTKHRATRSAYTIFIVQYTMNFCSQNRY